jgi:hypothetical protein
MQRSAVNELIAPRFQPLRQFQYRTEVLPYVGLKTEYEYVRLDILNTQLKVVNARVVNQLLHLVNNKAMIRFVADDPIRAINGN